MIVYLLNGIKAAPRNGLNMARRDRCTSLIVPSKRDIRFKLYVLNLPVCHSLQPGQPNAYPKVLSTCWRISSGHPERGSRTWVIAVLQQPIGQTGNADGSQLVLPLCDFFVVVSHEHGGREIAHTVAVMVNDSDFPGLVHLRTCPNLANSHRGLGGLDGYSPGSRHILGL